MLRHGLRRATNVALTLVKRPCLMCSPLLIQDLAIVGTVLFHVFCL